MAAFVWPLQSAHFLSNRPLATRLRTAEVLDQIRTRGYEVQEHSANLPEEQAAEVLGRWEGELDEVGGLLIGSSFTEWLERDTLF